MQIGFMPPMKRNSGITSSTGVSKSRAIGEARRWIEKWAPLRMKNLEFRDASYIEDVDVWHISWRRKENDVRFREDNTLVCIHAADGSLANFRREMYSAMPDNLTDKPYSKELAIERTKSMALSQWESTAGMKLSQTSGTLSLTGIELMAVRPTSTQWLSKHGWPPPKLDGQTRFAYIVSWGTIFPPGRPEKPLFNANMFFWIDYKTGETLGGDEMGFFMMP